MMQPLPHALASPQNLEPQATGKYGLKRGDSQDFQIDCLCAVFAMKGVDEECGGGALAKGKILIQDVVMYSMKNIGAFVTGPTFKVVS